MIFPEQIHRREKQLYHFIAAGNAFCPFFNLAVSQICSCSIDGIQKFVYTGVVFQLELNFYLPDSNHQAISRIPVTTEKLIGIMVQRIIFYFSRNRVVIFLCHYTTPPFNRTSGISAKAGKVCCRGGVCPGTLVTAGFSGFSFNSN